MRLSALSILCIASAAHAQPPSSLETLDARLGEEVRRLGVTEAHIELSTTWPSGSPHGAELEQRLRAMLGTHVREVNDPSRVLRIEARAWGGHLDLVLTTTADGWLRFRRWLGGHGDTDSARIRVPLDAQLRSWVATRAALTASSIVAQSYPLPASDYLDMAVIDLDGRDAPELVLLRAEEIQVVRIGSTDTGRRRLELVARAAIPPSDRPGVGTRRPIGTLMVDDEGIVGRVRHRLAPFRVGWADGAPQIAFLDRDPCPAGAHPLADACAMPVDGRDYFASDLLSRIGQPPPTRASTSFYQRQSRWIRRSDGSADRVEVVVTPRGRLVSRTGDHAVGLAGYGAGVGMADVDGDGNAELIGATSNLIGSGDKLTVLRIMRNGALRRLWESEPIEGSVMVGGQGDLDGDAAPELLAIEERDRRARLWVVR